MIIIDMENKPSISRLRRVKAVLTRKQKKYVTLDMLARWVGLYSDVLADDLVYFNPLVRMDPSINMMDLLPNIESYLLEIDQQNEEKRLSNPPRQVVRKKELQEYRSIGDFIYHKMAGAGGLISPAATLSDHDLHLLQALVKREIAKRKKRAKNS